jgi:hypothetical protein
MSDTPDIYVDHAKDSPLWRSLHRDANHLEKKAFTATHAETIRRHYLNNGRHISTEQAKDMVHEVWWDVRILGVDPTIGIHMPPSASSNVYEG